VRLFRRLQANPPESHASKPSHITHPSAFFGPCKLVEGSRAGSSGLLTAQTRSWQSNTSSSCLHITIGEQLDSMEGGTGVEKKHTRLPSYADQACNMRAHPPHRGQCEVLFQEVLCWKGGRCDARISMGTRCKPMTAANTRLFTTCCVSW
jgi:hypothetical protein